MLSLRFVLALSWLTNVALLLVLSWCPLPIAFGLYFITQHSISAWGHLSTNLTDRKSLWKHTIPFSLGAYVTFFILFVLFRDVFQMYQGVIVVFLAAISFPHILCMAYFYKKIALYNHVNREHLVDSSLQIIRQRKSMITCTVFHLLQKLSRSFFLAVDDDVL